MIRPLREGRAGLKDQAAKLGVAVPVGKTVAEIRSQGFDTDPDWPDGAVLRPHSESPTGFVIELGHDEQIAVWALAT